VRPLQLWLLELCSSSTLMSMRYCIVPSTDVYKKLRGC